MEVTRERDDAQAVPKASVGRLCSALAQALATHLGPDSPLIKPNATFTRGFVAP